MATWYLDTNAVLNVCIRKSRRAASWFDERIAVGDKLVSSMFLEVEARHVVTNLGADHQLLDGYLANIELMDVDSPLMAEAINIPGIMSGADAIHLATALRIFDEVPTIVTSDAQFARAARALEFAVFDPVTA